MELRDALLARGDVDEAGFGVLFDPQPPRDYDLAQDAYRRGERLSDVIAILRDSIDDFDNSTDLRHQIGLIPQRALLGECLCESGDLAAAARQYELAMQQVVRIPAFLAQVAWPDNVPTRNARENQPGADTLTREATVNLPPGLAANDRRGLWRSAAVLIPAAVPARFLVVRPANREMQDPWILTPRNLRVLQGVDIHEVLAMALLVAHRRTTLLAELAASDETLARTVSALTPPANFFRQQGEMAPDRVRLSRASLASRQLTVATQHAMQWLEVFQKSEPSKLSSAPANEGLSPLDQLTLDADSVTRISARVRILHVQRGRARAEHSMQSLDLVRGHISMLQQAVDHAAAVGRPETVVESMRLIADLALELPANSMLISDLANRTEHIITAYEPVSPVVAGQLRVVHARFLRHMGRIPAAITQLTRAERSLNASQTQFNRSLARLNRVRERCLHEQIEATLRVPINREQEIAISRWNRMAESASALWRNFANSTTPSHPAAFRDARFLVLTARNPGDDLPDWRRAIRSVQSPVLWDRFEIACARNSLNLEVAARGIQASARTASSGDVLAWIDHWLSRRGLAVLGASGRGIDFYAALRLQDGDRLDALTLTRNTTRASTQQIMVALSRLKELDPERLDVFDRTEATRRRRRMDRLVASEVAAGIVTARLVPPGPPERDGRIMWPRLPKGTVVASMVLIDDTIHVVVCQEGQIGHHRVDNAEAVIRQLNQFRALDTQLRNESSKTTRRRQRQRDQLRLDITRAVFPPLRSFDPNRCERLLLVPDNEFWNAPASLWARDSDENGDLLAWSSQFLLQVSPTPSCAYASACESTGRDSDGARLPSLLVQTHTDEDRFGVTEAWLKSLGDIAVAWGADSSPGGSRDWSRRFDVVTRLDPARQEPLDIRSTRTLSMLIDLHTENASRRVSGDTTWQRMFERSFRAHAAGVKDYWVNRRYLSTEEARVALEELIPELAQGPKMEAWQRYQAILQRSGNPFPDQLLGVSGKKILAADD
ncbi:MAG: hypothetical protein AAGD07_15400 [Planctomycetota bacterium]